MTDLINKPAHYDFFIGIEVKDIIRIVLNSQEASHLTPYQQHCLGCKLKYHLRAGKKDDVHQELGKADKYLEMAIEDKV